MIPSCISPGGVSASTLLRMATIASTFRILKHPPRPPGARPQSNHRADRDARATRREEPTSSPQEGKEGHLGGSGRLIEKLYGRIILTMPWAGLPFPSMG